MMHTQGSVQSMKESKKGSGTSNDGAGSIVIVQILYATVIPWDLLMFAS